MADPASKHAPLVITGLSRRRGWQVVAMCPKAGRAGVHPGLPVSEAQALLTPRRSRRQPAIDDCRWDVDRPAVDRQALQALAIDCQRFSPMVGLEDADRPESLLLELTGCAHLFGSEAALIAELIAELRSRGYVLRAGLSETVGAAWALAHGNPARGPAGGDDALMLSAVPTATAAEIQTGNTTATATVPTTVMPATANGTEDTTAITHRLRPLPVTALRISEAAAKALNQVGIVICGQLFDLPREVLPSRFGRDLVRRIQQALGERSEAIVPERLQQPFQARWNTDWPVADQRAIELVFAQLLQQLFEQHLTPRRAGVLELRCVLQGDDPAVEMVLMLSQPCADLAHLQKLFQLRCERQTWSGKVHTIELELRQIAALTQRQSMLFEEEAEQRQRTVTGMIDRLVSRLGHEAVVRPRRRFDPLPEQSWSWEPWSAARGSAASDSVESHSVEEEEQAEEEAQMEPAQQSGSTGKRSHAWGEVAKHRPLQLLPRPQPLAAVWLHPNGIPQRLQHQGQSEWVARAWGPERIAAGWWRSSDELRDYFRIETQTGDHWWIFHRDRPEGWFLHGYFV